MARLVKDGRGISDAIVTTILFATFITICVSALFYAQLNLTIQSEQVDLENAKRSMISLADTISSLGKKGQAAYVKLSSKTGGLWVTRESRIRIRIGGETYEYDLTLLKFRSNAPSGGFQVFKGLQNYNPADFLIVSPDSPGPLGWVYLNRSYGAWIIVDFGRVRIVPTGRISVQGSNYTVVDVTYFNIVPGSLSGTDVFNVCVKVRDVKVETVYTAPSARITVERGVYSKSYDIPYENDVQGAIVFLNIVEVEVSTG
ncbi:MAG: hypothetical protein JTT15_07105 [Candidatus Brockarchaeota archaeon]|nr:hypothetical protein [Candidatus Brockarchaeota archaeon]